MKGPISQELRSDKDIDRVLAFVFIGFSVFSLYNFLNSNNMMFRIEVAASMPLNIMAGISFWIRDAAREQTRTNEVLVPVISFALPFLAMNSPLVYDAPYSIPSGLVLAMLGGTLSIISIIFLRRSFAIMPSVRTVVTGGPYRAIRHPLYLGELVYAAGMVMLAFSVLSIVLLMLSTVFLLLRIRIEERKLMQYPEYDGYVRKVRFRLIPFMY